MSGELGCFGCTGATPEGGSTVILARRIMTRTKDAKDQIWDAEATVQICPECFDRAQSGTFPVSCSMAPLLDSEYSGLFQYMRHTADGKTLSGSCALPDRCSRCLEGIPENTKYLFVEISTESEVWRWKEPRCPSSKYGPTAPPDALHPSANRWEKVVESRNVVPLLNLCSLCTTALWTSVHMDLGLLRMQCCATRGCPVCARLKDAQGGERSKLKIENSSVSTISMKASSG